MKKTIATILALLGLTAFAVGVYVLFHVIDADGRVTFCYTRYVSPADLPPVYQLFGHREWRSDTLMATKTTYEEIVYAAEIHHCALSSAPAGAPAAKPPTPQVPSGVSR